MPLSEQQIKEHLVTWRPLVTGLAFRFRKRLGAAHDNEDIVSMGMEALWRAAQTFDESRGAKFSTYANRCVLYRYLLEVKNLNTSTRRVVHYCKQSLDEAHEDGTPKLTPANEQFRDPEAALLHSRDELALKRARKLLPERHNWVLKQRIERDRTLEEISVDLGLTRERVRQIEAEAIEKLRARVCV